MPVHKDKNRQGKVIGWYYQFAGPGATRQNRNTITKRGFATKQAATDAESEARLDAIKKAELVKTGAAPTAAAAELPKTLGSLLDEFLNQHAEQKLAAKTVERYRDQAGYIAQELRDLPLTAITPLHLSREWDRLLKTGGHTRKKNGLSAARQMSAKTVRNIAGVVSSAYTRAIRWGLATANPVKNSEPPVPKKHLGIALTPQQQDLAIETACGPWCMKMFLVMCSASACRRGEVLALRWSDIQNGIAAITRSLTQTHGVLAFKCVKNEKPHVVALDDDTLAALEEHRKRQDLYRAQFPDYRADLDLIFANPDGTPLKPDSISATVSRICRTLKLPKGASLHTLRHTHASYLLADGVPIPVVSARLGHSSIRTTTEIYAHMITGQDQDAAKRWADFKRRNQPVAITPSQTEKLQ